MELRFANNTKPNFNGGGTLGGLIQAYQETVPYFIGKLDDLASSIMNRVNYQHLQGFGLDGVSGRSFFQDIRTAEAVGEFSFDASVDKTTTLDLLGITAGTFEIMGVELTISPDDVKPAEAITLGDLLDRINMAQPWVRAVLVEDSLGEKTCPS